MGTVQTAFGETPGAIAGDFNWISGATDNAIYPALFLTYLTGNGGNSKYVGWFQKILLHKCTQPGVGGFQLPGP